MYLWSRPDNSIVDFIDTDDSRHPAYPLARDNLGRVRVSISAKADLGPTMMFLDRDGHARVEISIRDDKSPGVRLLDKNEQTRLELSIQEEDEASVSAFNGDRSPAFQLVAGGDKTTEQRFFSPSGVQRISLKVKPDGKEPTNVRWRWGQPALGLDVSPEGDARQSFLDRAAKERISLSVDKSGDSLMFPNVDRTRRACLSILPDGTSLNVLYDKAGNRRMGSYVLTKWHSCDTSPLRALG